jgi:hypothetical protein
MAIRMIGSHGGARVLARGHCWSRASTAASSNSQRMLDAGADVHARRGSPQEPPFHERSQDDMARIGVEIPESLRLCFGKLQARHFVVLALDSSNQWREAAHPPLRGW